MSLKRSEIVRKTSHANDWRSLGAEFCSSTKSLALFSLGLAHLLETGIWKPLLVDLDLE